MADVDSLADSQLRNLARKIDRETLKNLGTAELRVRVETASGLYDDMARTGDEYEVRRLDREAGRVLNAVSLKAWLLRAKVLCDAVDLARESGGDMGAASAGRELERWVRDHPQPGLGDPAVMAEIAGVNGAVDRPRRRFRFWRKRNG